MIMCAKVRFDILYGLGFYKEHTHTQTELTFTFIYRLLINKLRFQVIQTGIKRLKGSRLSSGFLLILHAFYWSLIQRDLAFRETMRDTRDP